MGGMAGSFLVVFQDGRDKFDKVLEISDMLLGEVLPEEQEVEPEKGALLLALEVTGKSEQ